MAMRKAFELKCTPAPLFPAYGVAPIKVRMTAVSFEGESRSAFFSRARAAASILFESMTKLYGPLNVEWTHK